jgi:hypothetical protein
MPASGFVQNTTTQQSGANLNIGGNATMSSLNVNGPASFGGVAAPAVAPAGQGRLYFDATSNKLRVSENGGAFVNLVGATGVGGSGTANTIPVWSTSTTLGNSVITQSAGNAGIGTTNPTLGKLQVESNTGTSVYGLSGGGSFTDDAGVIGKSTLVGGNGVIGEANNGSSALGVWGISTSGNGVRGVSVNGTGVYGVSNSGAALYSLGTSFFQGDTHPLATNYGKGVAIGFNQSTTVGYLFAYNYGTSQTQSLALNHLGGNVGIGTANPQRLLHVSGRVRIGSIPSEAGITDHVCTNVSGDLLACGTSSLRYKQNVRPYRQGLDVVRRLRPISFDWKADGRADFGLGAEDVARIAPALAFTNEKGEVEGVKYERLNLLLINAIKEQQKLIERLQARLARLERAARRRGAVRQPIKITAADSRK